MFSSVRKALNPPYSYKDLFVLFVVLFLLLTIPLLFLKIGEKNFFSFSSSSLAQDTNLTVRFSNLTQNDVLKDKVSVSVEAAGDYPIDEVRILMDGTLLSLTKNSLAQKTSLSTAFDLYTTDFENGAHQLSATVSNYQGDESTEEVKIQIDNPADKEAPVVSFISPNEGQKLARTANVVVQASDNRAVASLELSIAGKVVVSTTLSKLSYSWNLSPLAAGSYTLQAKAVDIYGNTSEESINVYHSASILTR